jgi:hypothetical protein
VTYVPTHYSDAGGGVTRAPYRTLKLTFDLLIEIDLTARPSDNREKFLAYDGFLCGWSLAQSRYRALGTRPAVVFVSPNGHAALEADELMAAGSGSWAAHRTLVLRRDHVFFAVESDIHRGIWTRLRCRRTRRGCGNGSREAGNSRSNPSLFSITRVRQLRRDAGQAAGSRGEMPMRKRLVHARGRRGTRGMAATEHSGFGDR